MPVLKEILKEKKWRQTLKTKLYCFLFDAPSGVLDILEVPGLRQPRPIQKLTFSFVIFSWTIPEEKLV
jgi:hypothetical protein